MIGNKSRDFRHLPFASPFVAIGTAPVLGRSTFTPNLQGRPLQLNRGGFLKLYKVGPLLVISGVITPVSHL